jgi:uncharacterized protein (TIGR02147 family)
MILQNYEYIYLLKEAYEQKKQKNPSFSVRSFSKYLGLGETFLSLLFNGRRQLPVEKAKTVAEKLNFDEKSREVFISSVEQAQVTVSKLCQLKVSDDRALIEDHDSELNYEIIAKNKYFTFLSLLDIENRVDKMSWMAEMMDLEIEDLKDLVLNLKKAGYLKLEGEIFKKIALNFQSPPNLFSKAVKESLNEGLNHAIDILNDCPVDKRHFFSETFVIAEDQIPHAKKLLSEFTSKFAEMIELDSHEKSNRHVYMLSTQLLPLTNIHLLSSEEEK